VLRVGTLSKALGSVGGFVAGPRRYVELLRNRARPFIFTTATTPGDTAAALAALRVVRSAEGVALAATLRHHVDRLRPGHPTPIVPIVVGAEDDALAASAALLERGLLVPAIRPPTVAPGTSRLRVALSAAHTDDQVDRLLAALADLGLDDGLGPAAAGPDDPFGGAGGGGAPGRWTTSSWQRAARRSTASLADPTGGPLAGGPAPGGPLAGGPATGGLLAGGPLAGGPATGGPATGGPAAGGPAAGGAPEGGAPTDPTGGAPGGVGPA
jgi:hypothetical protein